MFFDQIVHFIYVRDNNVPLSFVTTGSQQEYVALNSKSHYQRAVERNIGDTSGVEIDEKLRGHAVLFDDCEVSLHLRFGLYSALHG